MGIMWPIRNADPTPVSSVQMLSSDAGLAIAKTHMNDAEFSRTVVVQMLKRSCKALLNIAIILKWKRNGSSLNDA
jgi:hypothetical protein